MSEFLLPVRVYIEDTDAGGIVYYVNYLKYMERARTELLRSLGYDKAAILDENYLLVVRSAEVDYLLPARLDEELTVSAKGKKVAKTYIDFFQEVRRNDHILCRASVKVACVQQRENNFKPVALPGEIREVLKAWCHQE